MKKVAIITLLVFTSLMLFACAPGTAAPTATASPAAASAAPAATEAPATSAAPTAQTEALTKEDFDIYEDGKCILKKENFENNAFFFANELTENYAERELETKRGIKIGSTAQELAEAYGDIVSDSIGKSKKEGITYAEFLANQEEYDNGEKNHDYIVTYTGEMIDGVFNVVTESDKQHLKDIIAMGKPAMSYHIIYDILDGKVLDIKIAMIDIMSLKDMLTGATEAPAAPTAQTEPLTKEDFDIYEDGKCILKTEDYEYSGFFFADELAENYAGRALETKRGIAIGSTAQEIAEAYGDIVPSLIGKSKKEGISYAEFLANEEEYDNGKQNHDYVVIYHGELIDGVFNVGAEPGEQHFKDVIAMGKPAISYSIYYNILDGKVLDIQIAMLDIMSLKDVLK